VTKRYWLVKSEPEVFSIDDLLAAPKKTTGWGGVRNFQARNLLRDELQPGDPVLYYHSNAEPPGVAGEAVVVKAGHPDPTQFDPKDEHFDPKATPAAPIWFQVELKAVAKFARFVGLPELRAAKGLEKMVLLRKGSRLSVQPVTEAEFALIRKLGQG
jgi:predicted RNA-binding protein with PUA-like domain